MRILLFSMPDDFEHLPSIFNRLPNGALVSLAGNIDPWHDTAVADLILVQGSVPETIRRLMASHDPDVVGLSIMTFQRHTAMAIIDYVRSLKPGVTIVVGGYDPSLAREVYTDVANPKIDFLVKGEGEITFRELIRAIESKSGFAHIDGLSYRSGNSFRHNPDRGVSSLGNQEILPPKRSARVLNGYTMCGRQADVIETSRGCTFDCSFCSIIEMRGRNFFKFDVDRVIADIRDAYDRGARHIFIIDDNITLNMRRFETLCQAIIEAGLNSIDYSIQGMTSAFADHGERLAPLMRKAGFRWVFLGIENIVEKDLEEMKASAKNRLRKKGRHVGNASITAIRHLRKNKILVVGGLIVGSPTDSTSDVEANLEFARRWVDWPYIQHPVPYPGTPMSYDFEKRGLIANRNFADYAGTTPIVTCAKVSASDLEFMRWKAERWIKTRQAWRAFPHDPLFWWQHWWASLLWHYRGETIWSALGLASKRKAFGRYREIRNQERDRFVRALVAAGAQNAENDRGDYGRRETGEAASRALVEQSAA